MTTTNWRPGLRHQVKGAEPNGWECVDCGQWFSTWPSDAAECPGPEGGSELTEVITYSRREAELLAAARAAIAGQPEATERLRLAVEAYPSQPANYDPRDTDQP